MEGQRKEKARTWKKDEKKAKRAKKSFGKRRAMSDVIKGKPLTVVCYVVKTLVMGMLAKELKECLDGRG